MVDWSSRGVEASSVGEIQELWWVAARAEISLSRPSPLFGTKGNTNTPHRPSPLSTRLLLSSDLHPGSATEFSMSTRSPLCSHTSMGGVKNKEQLDYVITQLQSKGHICLFGYLFIHHMSLQAYKATGSSTANISHTRQIIQYGVFNAMHGA